MSEPGWVAVVATAGDSVVCQNLVRRLKRKLQPYREKKLTEEIIENLVDGVLAHAYTTYIDPDVKAEGVGLIIGVVCDQERFLISTNRRAHRFHDIDTPYAYQGYGSDVAVYLLDRIHDVDDDYKRGLQVTGFVLAEVKETAQFTSGDTDFYVLQSPPNPRWRSLGPEISAHFDINEKIEVGKLIRGEFTSDLDVSPNADYTYRDEFHPNWFSDAEIEALREERFRQLKSQRSKGQP